MEPQYSIRFTGKFLNPSEQVAIENLASFFPSLKIEEIEPLIKNKMIFKKSIDLTLANKIKSKFEQAGAECLIFTESPESSQSTQEKEAISLANSNSDKKSGILIIAASIFLILCTFLLSNGYDPRGGLLWSLSESMYLYEGYPFGCSEIKYHGGGAHRTPDGKLSLDISSMTTTGGCADSLRIEISTRHTLFILLCVGMFGVGRYFGVVKPIPHYWNRVKNALG
ncbi:hypothetical protein M0M42_16925 [Pseudomonas knackmussii]|uniref:Uncharacterized protein n=2 Tax=Pseudomonadaceae TaxID=135621 RepID=A0ABY4KMI2_9PSED|nr:hypothetical protein [Pseudomonas knackmussii]UPQ82067.1 hypothetical protein M0M42_16925 [Pseudomonas knackmussii]